MMNRLVVVAGGGCLPHLLMRSLLNSGTSFSLLYEANFYQSEYESSFDIDLSAIQKTKLLDPVPFKVVWQLRMKYFFCCLKVVCVGKFFKLSSSQSGGRSWSLKSDEECHRKIRFLLFFFGIQLVSPAIYLSDEHGGHGLLSGNTKDIDWRLINYYVSESRKLMNVDIGQSVFFFGKNPIAIEGIEGTDRAIRRVGLMVGSGWVLVKLKKPHQSLNLDLPSVGPDTIRQVYKYRGKGLIIDAQNTLFVDKAKTLSLADQLGIFVYGA